MRLPLLCWTAFANSFFFSDCFVYCFFLCISDCQLLKVRKRSRSFVLSLHYSASFCCPHTKESFFFSLSQPIFNGETITNLDAFLASWKRPIISVVFASYGLVMNTQFQKQPYTNINQHAFHVVRKCKMFCSFCESCDRWRCTGCAHHVVKSAPRTEVFGKGTMKKTGLQ